VPARPAQRRIAVHVLGIDDGARIEQKLDGLFVTERGGAVQGRLALSTAIAHERTGLDVGLRRAVRIRSACKQHLQDEIVGRAVRRAERRVERRFSGIRKGVVHIRTVFDQELAQAPVTVKGCRVQVEARAQ
jgi:hypothetical protein